MSQADAERFVVVLLGVGAVLVAIFLGGAGIARWARKRGRRPWVWVVGAYVAACVVLAALTGCVQKVVYVTNHDGSRPDQRRLDRDTYECDRESVTYAGGSGLVGAVAILGAKSEARRVYMDCLKARGYRVSEGEEPR